MKIAVVDDDIQMYRCLQTYLSELLCDSVDITHFASGEAILRDYEPGTFDLIVLDIFMNGLDGVETAREIRRSDSEVKIVFCTSSNEFASESYEVSASYYLTKPFSIDKVKTMLDRLDITGMEKMRTVKLPDGKSVVLRNIIYADCASHSITLHCKQGENIVLRARFSETEPLLCAYPYFFSPIKGVVINFYEVAEQRRDTFCMSDGSLIPISRRRANEVTEAYSSFCFERLRKEW